MNVSFLLRIVASFAVVCVVASLALAPVLWIVQRHLGRLAPAARVRLLLALAAAPFFVAAALQLGWVVYHHVIDPSSLTATHDCSIPLTWPLALVGALMSVRVGRAAARVSHGAWRSFATGRRLAEISDVTAEGLHVTDEEVPHAFVLGLWRPRVFLSRGLLRAMDAPAVAAIVAHERAHVRRRDPLRRLIASLLLAFHVPAVARRLEALVARAHEVAADAEAASVVGDRPSVAQTLVRLARLRLAPSPVPLPSASVLGSDLEARVLDLLGSPQRADFPSAFVVGTAAAVVTALAVAFAEPLHAGGEVLARLFG